MSSLKHIFIFLLLALLPVSSFAKEKEVIVMLHGIARSNSHMEDLQIFLEDEGYVVHNLNYPSTDHKIEELIKMVGTEISKKINDDEVIHFVGYSMGGLITRGVLNSEYRPKNLGKVVQLASPNKGSEVADFWKDFWLYKKIYGKSGQQLGKEVKDTKFQNVLGKVNYDLGIIAGNYTIDPFSSYLINGDDDGKVSVESTKLEGMKDHIIVNASHTFFPQNSQIHKQVLYFLKNGKFTKGAGE